MHGQTWMAGSDVDGRVIVFLLLLGGILVVKTAATGQALSMELGPGLLRLPLQCNKGKSAQHLGGFCLGCFPGNLALGSYSRLHINELFKPCIH